MSFLINNLWNISFSLVLISSGLMVFNKFFKINRNTIDGEELFKVFIRVKMAKAHPNILKNKVFITEEFSQKVSNSILEKLDFLRYQEEL